MDLDEVCFQRVETQDYKIEDLVKPPETFLKHLIDYRVKLLLKNDIVLQPGQEVLVATVLPEIGNKISCEILILDLS